MSRKRKMNLFYILKLNTSYIVANGYEINLTFNEAKKENIVVALGDNQLLRFIRQVKNITFDKEAVDELYERRNFLKSLPDDKGNRKEIGKLQNQIDELLYVPDLISVRTDTTKKDYKYICKNRFVVNMTINGKKHHVRYRRICAGAGQLRRNSALFINEEIFDEVETVMMCGLTRKRIGKINLAKFGAYLALVTSASNKVTTPRICVVDDYEFPLKDQTVQWIYKDIEGKEQVDTRKIDFPKNAFDGAGIVSPEMAEKWGNDLGLDYTPCSFIVRAPFLKGLVSTFPFHEFAEEVAKTDTIIDHWGIPHKVRDIDVIMSISQFKMHKHYQNFESYMFNFVKYKHTFGVARVSKKKNDFVTTLNYQYIQSNDYTEEGIKGLADFTVDWLRKIMSGDKLYTELFLIGCQDDDDEYESVERKVDSAIAKALMYNDSILNDSYVRQKINQMIDKKIRLAKIGKLYVEGSYDFAIPDLYAFCEHAFGMPVNGILKPNESWNMRWVEKSSKQVAMMRSPLVAPSENQLSNVNMSEEAKHWFRYIYSGQILSIKDLAIELMSDEFASR